MLIKKGKLSTGSYVNAGNGFDFGIILFTCESRVKKTALKPILNNHSRNN